MKRAAPLLSSLLTVAFAAGCATGARPPGPLGDANASSASSAPNGSRAGATSGPTDARDASVASVAGDAGTTFALPEIPAPAPGVRGPLRIEGYPAKLAVGMSDAAGSFGFTRDGAFAYCMFDVCCREGQSACELLDADGTTRHLLSPVMFADDPKAPRRERKTVKELQQFVKDEKLAGLVGKSMEDMKPPPPTGEWAYGGEMTLVVHESPPREGRKATGEDFVPGMVKLGARLQGEQVVFVYFPPRPQLCALPTTCFEAQMNALMLSPDAKELGVLTYTRHSSHGSTISPSRVGTDAFAAMVLNATGHAHHRTGDYARAITLFTRAVYADPNKEVYVYNLACALARIGDARARHALAHALRLGGAKVAERARKDADFAAVKSEPWFEATLAK